MVCVCVGGGGVRVVYSAIIYLQDNRDNNIKLGMAKLKVSPDNCKSSKTKTKTTKNKHKIKFCVSFVCELYVHQVPQFCWCQNLCIVFFLSQNVYPPSTRVLSP